MAHVERVRAVMGDDVLPLAVTWIRESEHRVNSPIEDSMDAMDR